MGKNSDPYRADPAMFDPDVPPKNPAWHGVWKMYRPARLPKQFKIWLAIFLIIYLIELLLIIGVILFRFLDNQQAKQPLPYTLTSPTPIPDPTASWKTYRFTDKYGFGYALKIPNDWVNHPWVGHGSTSLGPNELLQNFYDRDKCNRVYILHFYTNTRALGNDEEVTYLDSAKGHYEIRGTNICHETFNKNIYAQILSTFKFLDQKQIINVEVPPLYSGVEWKTPENSSISKTDQLGKIYQAPAIVIYSKPVKKIPLEMLWYYKNELEKRGWIYDPNLITEGGYSSGNGEDGWFKKNGRYFYIGSQYGKTVSVRYSK